MKNSPSSKLPDDGKHLLLEVVPLLLVHLPDHTSSVVHHPLVLGVHGGPHVLDDVHDPRLELVGVGDQLDGGIRCLLATVALAGLAGPGSGGGPKRVMGVLGLVRLLRVPRHGVLLVRLLAAIRLIAVTRFIPAPLELQLQIIHIKGGQVQESNQEAQANLQFLFEFNI